jgi:WD40 repeat protein
MQLLSGRRNAAVRSLAFAGEGQYLASCAGQGTSVTLWRLATGKRSNLSGHGRAVVRVAASARGGWLASEDEGGGHALWSLHDGIPDRPVDAYDAACFHSTFHPDGYILAGIIPHSGPVAESILYFEDIWRPEEEGDWVRLPQPITAVIATVWSPDGQTFAISLSNGSNGDHYLIDVDPLRALPDPIVLEGIGRHLAFSPDSQTLAVHTAWQFSLLDLATGALVREPVASTGWTRGMAFLSGGRLLTAETENGAGHTRIWDVASGKMLDNRDWGLGPLTALAVAPDGMRAAVGSERGQILVFDLD